MLAVTLIGDLVSSREHGDRHRLHRRLDDGLRQVNSVMQPTQPLELTVGDEFQGCFESVGRAARASLLLRLILLADDFGSDSRYGLGWGEVTVFDASRAPISQDGPGWWAARAAIERAEMLAQSPRTSFVRTCLVDGRDGDPAAQAYDAAVDAFLICRDSAVGQMSDRQRRLLAGVLVGRGQRELAATEHITQGAVSQTLSRSGATAIEIAHQRLEEIA